jgi:hypothetical protein
MAEFQLNAKFNDLLNEIDQIGLDWHQDTIVENSKINSKFVTQSLRDIKRIQGKKSESAIVISAGPSLYKNNILERIKDGGYAGTVIAIDGSLVRCLKARLIPDYVLTLDPHPTRIIRWFGDPEFEKNSEGDDYFSRQDLDISFRKDSIMENNKNRKLITERCRNMKLAICSSAPINVVNRALDVGFDMYWWAPLVDSLKSEQSITKNIISHTGLPAMNTGGTVGTAAWVFATMVLQIPKVAVVGMDLGYYKNDTSYKLTQTYHSLIERVGVSNIQEYFPEIICPQSGEPFYTDPTYYWYRQNMLDLIKASKTTLFNCTGAGTLFGPGVTLVNLEEFMEIN